jgi:uncharacterized protein (DUF305 family)
MTTTHFRWLAAVATALAMPACGTTARQTGAPQPQLAGDAAAVAKARADSARYPYTAADIHFMSGMISHHAQAIKMAGMAESHDAGPSVRRLCERIINAQGDEIKLMQQWLRDRNQPVPAPNPDGMKMTMNGMEHVMLMPGMLTDAQMKQLDESHGQDFDSLFLLFMIQHHHGAVAMVKDLFASYGAGQDELVFKFASDVNVDQSTEIVRMQNMLTALTNEKRAP